MLNRVVYTRYNERYGQDGIHVPIDWSKYEVIELTDCSFLSLVMTVRRVHGLYTPR